MPRFVEVEDDQGGSIEFAEWLQRGDGHWALRLADGARGQGDAVP